MAGKSDNMSVEKIIKKEKNQNIQVVVRLRPPNVRERDIKSHSIVEVSNNREIVVKPAVGFSKKFTFDRAFGPSSSQVEVYHEVVSPLISEVLNGYNCTVFAYGQTGTGKTHTMVGENTGSDLSWQNDPLAGIIPRALSQIFDELRIINSEYTIRVSYLELYNEELCDLLSASEDNSKLRIYEDSSRKGSNIVNGLEEVTVYSKSEVYKIMEKGQERRKIASTLMNAQSSRSHTVFTIVVHMKENSPEGEELMKIGKLNLVDLAGSENISKAGTDNPQKKERARECVNINQSLLTLGRVITALVERHPHIPYRESKLTRLLQESLGGRTKTSIIATISPGHKDMEETLSTLEYAHRAKNIQNKPEVNQKMTKKAVLKEYSEEIDRLKRDLQASREKNGVYLANESYNEMLFRLEDQEKEIQNKILEIKSLMDEKDRLATIFNDLSFKLQEKEAVIETTTQDLSATKNTLESTKQVLSQTSIRYEEQKHLVQKHVETESTLGAQAQNLLHTTEQLNNDVSHLHATVDKRKNLESKNLTLTRFFGEKSKNHLEQMKETLNTFSSSYHEDLLRIGEMVDELNTESIKKETAKKKAAESLIGITSEAIAGLKEIRKLNVEKMCAFLHSERESMQQNIEKRAQDVESRLLNVLDSVSHLAELGTKDKIWIDDIHSFVMNRKNNHQSNHVKLRACYDNVYSEMKSHLHKLSTAYTREMDEQMTFHRRFRQNAEQQNKEMEEQNVALTNVLSVLKNELESSALKNKKMHSIISKLNDENEQLVKRRQEDFSAMLKSEYAEAENINGKFISTLDDTMKSEEDFTEQLANKYNEQALIFEQESNSHLGIMTEMKNVLSTQKECFTESGTQIKLAIDKIISTQSEAMDLGYQQLQEFNEKCSNDLTQLAMSSDDLLKHVTDSGQAVQKEFGQQKENLMDFREQFHESLLAWDSMETEYLSKEYKVYSPTGKTPNRKDYQYPKELVATSPHERLLKRFRSIPSSSHEGIATIDLSESLLEASPAKEAKLKSISSGSSFSDDSTCMFIEPANKTPRKGVEKSTSEGNIHMLMGSDKKSGKENANDSSSSESKAFRSKLRQPMKKKVLSNHNN